MTMEQTEKTYLAELAKAARVRLTFEDRQEKQEKLLDKARAAIDAERDAIRDDLTFFVIQNGKKVYSMTETSQQTDEFELDEAGLTSGLTEEQRPKVLQRMEKIMQLQRELQQSGLFDDEEITEEFYGPLVREKLVPETLVDKRFSKTQKMLDATNELYRTALKDLKPEDEEGKFATGKRVVGALGDFAQGIADVVGAPAKMAKNVIALTRAVAEASLTVADKLDKGDMQGAAFSIRDSVGDLLKQGLSLVNPDLADAVSQAYTKAVDAGRAAELLLQKPPKVKEAMNLFAGSVQGMLAAGGKLGGQKAHVDLEKLGEGLAKGFEMAATAKEVTEAAANGDSDAVMQGVFGFVKNGVAGAFVIKGSVGKKGGDEKLLTQMQAAVNGAEAVVRTGKALYEAYDKGDLLAAADQIVATVGDSLSNVLSTFAPPKVAGLLAASCKEAADLGQIANHLARGETDKALDVLGDSLETALGMAGKDNPGLQTAAAALRATFKTAAASAGIPALVKEGDFDAIAAAVGKAVQTAAGQALNIKDAAKPAAALSPADRKAVEDKIDVALKAGLAVASAAKAGYDAAKDPKAFVGAAQKIVDKLGGVLGGALEQFAPRGVADKAAAAYKAATAFEAVAFGLIEGNPDKALAALSSGLSEALAGCAAATGNKAFTVAGGAVQAAFEAAASGLQVGLLIAEGKEDQAAAQLAGVLKSVAGKALDLQGLAEASGRETPAQRKQREQQRQALKDKINTGVDVAQLVLEEGKNVYDLATKRKEVADTAQKMVARLQGTLDGVLKGFPDTVAKKISASFKGAVAGGTVAYHLLAGEPEKALEELGAGLTDALDQAAAGTGNKGLALAGGALRAAFEAAAAGVNLGKQLEDGNYQAAIDGVAAALQAAGGRALDLKSLAQSSPDDSPARQKQRADERARLGKVVSDAVAAGQLVATAVAQYRDKDRQRDITKTASDLVGKLGAALADGLKASKHDAAAAIAANAYKGATAFAPVAYHFLQGDPAAAVSELGSSLPGVLADCAQTSGRKELALAGSALQAVFESAAAGVDLKKLIDDKDYQKAIDGVAAAMKAAAGKALNLKDAAETTGKETPEQQQKRQRERRKLELEIDAALSAGKEIAAVAAAYKTPEAKKALAGAARKLVDGLARELVDVLKPLAPEAAKIAASAYKGATSFAPVAMSLIEGKRDQALAELSNGLPTVLNQVAAETGKKEFSLAASTFQAAFEAGAAGVDVAQLAVAGNDEEAVKRLVGALRKAAARSLDLAGKPQPTGGALTDLFGGADAAAQIEKEQAKVRDAKVAAELKRQEDTFKTELALMKAGGKEMAEARSIDNLIKQMQRDKIIMDMAVQVVSGGLEMASQFFTPLSAASAGVQMAASLMAAAQRAMDLNDWLKNEKDAISAGSVFTSSVKNFVTNQSEQFSYHAIKAALQAAQMIGGILSCGGVTSAAGAALNKVASLAEVGVDQLKQFYDEAEMKRAWALTRQALDNPNNRRLGLVARSINPTLAKYSVAWGACKGDAIAKSAMASCGLDATTLADRDTNVDKVVQYLEVRFSGDRQVRKALPKPPAWQPTKVVLEVVCWGKTKEAGEKEGKLKRADTGGIDGALTVVARLGLKITALEETLEKAKPAAAGEPPADPPERETLLTLLEEQHAQLAVAHAAFSAYKPVTSTGTPHKEMQVVVETFLGLVEAEQGTVSQKRVNLAKKAPAKPQDAAA
jgi:hypothetical protein